MPIYEYRCDECGHEMDALQKISDPVLTDCPACESKSLRKLVSAPNFRLKGSGWYETDFKGDKDTKRNLAAGDSEGKTAGDDKKEAKDSGDKKSDTKSDTKGKDSSSKSETKSNGKSSGKTTKAETSA